MFSAIFRLLYVTAFFDEKTAVSVQQDGQHNGQLTGKI